MELTERELVLLEAMRRTLNKLSRYSFLKAPDGAICRVFDPSGAYLEWAEVHALFDAEVYASLLDQNTPTPVDNLYVHKPLTVEARQWIGTSESTAEILQWANTTTTSVKLVEGTLSGNPNCDQKAYHETHIYCPACGYVNDGPDRLLVTTDDGDVIANVGDYIIEGVDGSFYPVKQENFTALFDPMIEE